MTFDLETKRVTESFDYLAPDNSEIRLLSVGAKGSMCHCTLPSGKTSSSVRHQGVEEIWYCVEGVGELWRKGLRPHEVVPITAGTSVVIPPRTAFQFRADSSMPLKLIIVTMPPWPGSQEAESANAFWS